MAQVPRQTTSPINWQTPIVNPDGTMTEPMRRLLQSITGNGSSSGNAVQDLINAELMAGLGITITPDGHLLSNPEIAADIQPLLDSISDVRGSVLYRGASAWSALAPGTSGQFLKTNGAGADPEWAAGGGGGSMTYVGGATVVGAAATTLSLSGLNLDSVGRYFITITLRNATASNANISLYYNADTTASNYNRQTITASSGTISGSRANDALIGGMDSNTASTGSGDTNIDLWLRKNFSARPSAQADAMRSGNSNILWQKFTQEWRTASTNVTSLIVSSSVANSLAIGSSIDCWGLSA